MSELLPLQSRSVKVVAAGFGRIASDDGDAGLEALRSLLTDRLRALEVQLLSAPRRDFEWISSSEVISMVEIWGGHSPLWVVVRDWDSPLGKVARTSGSICIAWPEADRPADIVIAGDIVLLGCVGTGVRGEDLDFITVHDPALAVELRRRTQALPQHPTTES